MRLSRPLRAPWDDPSQLGPALRDLGDDAARTGLPGGLLGLVEHRRRAVEVLGPAGGVRFRCSAVAGPSRSAIAVEPTRSVIGTETVCVEDETTRA
jgi:hypothetical protein